MPRMRAEAAPVAVHANGIRRRRARTVRLLEIFRWFGVGRVTPFAMIRGRRRRLPGGCQTSLVRAFSRTPATPIKGCAADRKSTRLNSSHVKISYAVFCLKKKNQN